MYALGKISKAHGYAGTLALVLDAPLDEKLEDLSEVFLFVDGLYVPYPIEEFAPITDTLVHIHLEFVNDREEAVKLAGCKVYANLQTPINQNVVDGFERWIGFTVHDSKNGKVGVIQKIDDYKGNIVIQIIDGGKETLLSFYPELVTNIDYDKKNLYITAPDGCF